MDDRGNEKDLSYGQRGLWFIQKLRDNQATYNINYTWEINSSLDIDVFKYALAQVSTRHPILRTTYHSDKSSAYQLTHEELITPLALISIDTMSNEELTSHLNSEIYQAYDLSKDAPWRWQVLQKENRPKYLIMSYHHIATDLWSIMIVLNELRDIYNAKLKGEDCSLPEIKDDYFQFIDQQNDFTASEKGEAQWQFWDAFLPSVVPNYDLPIVSRRSSQLSFKVDQYHERLSTDLCAKITAFAKQSGVTPYVFMCTAFHVYLHRLNGANEVYFGSATAGRGKRHFANVVGYFVNALLLGGKIDSKQPFDAFLNESGSVIRSAIKNKDYPFPLIVEKRSPPRDMTRAAMFQVAFGWEEPNSFKNKRDPIVSIDEYQKEHWQLGAIDLTLVSKTMIDEFDFKCRVRSIESQLELVWDYNPELLSEPVLASMSESFIALVNELINDPTKTIEEYSLVNETHAHQQPEVIDESNFNGFIQQFESQVLEHPNNTAVSYYDKTLSYSELNRKANQLARLLCENGVTQGSYVGISLPQSLKLITAVIAIMKTGAAYVPLDPDYPIDRLKHMSKDSGINAIIVNKVSRAVISSLGVSLLDLDQPNADYSNYSDENLSHKITPSDIAYVIYTSGTTGVPKGVPIEHRGLSTLAPSQAEVFGICADDRILQFSSINFDASIFAITRALGNGAVIVQADKVDLLPGKGLATLIRKQRITNALFPPSVLEKLPKENYSSLKSLVVGGEACPIGLAKYWAKEVRLFNAYGPTESTVWATVAQLMPESECIHLGKAVPFHKIVVLDEYHNILPMGHVGEVAIIGAGVSPGYLNRSELNNEKFITLNHDSSQRAYLTGDLGLINEYGNLVYKGRKDKQIKLRGYRIELQEIESALCSVANVDNAVVICKKNSGQLQLVAYYTATNVDEVSVRTALKQVLPDYMVPSHILHINEMPLTNNGKIDEASLPPIEPQSIKKYPLPKADDADELETKIKGIWKSAIGLEQVPDGINFFDAGGHSLLIPDVHMALSNLVKHDFPLIKLFEHTTVDQIASYLRSLNKVKDIKPVTLPANACEKLETVKDIAVIGMAANYPGAPDIQALWRVIKEGRETISDFSEQELLEAGVSAKLLRNSNYIRRRGMIENLANFDSEFFGVQPKEAEIMDPQQRLFLQCAWQALEDAGIVINTSNNNIGVFAGAGENQYWMQHLLNNNELLKLLGNYPITLANGKDFMCSRVSYKLNLRGPSEVIQTACSTSLIAIERAVTSLRNHQCDAAMAGGVSLGELNKTGYLYQPGMIFSPDGHCRPFDSRAEGTIPSQGVGIVVLKRLDDAIKNNDNIYAVIKGASSGNDGSDKIGYTAPSVKGQSAAIRAAYQDANIDPSKIGLIEAHGTGTSLGDPIELEGLKSVYGEHSSKANCAIGSIKSNIGHTDSAAGVAGFIKAVLALKYQQLPPTINFEKPNPKLGIEGSPFYIITTLSAWETNEKRRAAVSSFGLGGTNCHVVLEEWQQENTKSKAASQFAIFPISAKHKNGVADIATNISNQFGKSEPPVRAAVAQTLQENRTYHQYRTAVVASLQGRKSVFQKPFVVGKQDAIEAKSQPKLTFMFSGQGSQYVNMVLDLYSQNSEIKETIDYCFAKVKSFANIDLKPIIYPDSVESGSEINDTQYTQPALFIVEYALAKYLITTGIEPEGLIGHSIGEYAAACISGVFSLDDALKIVVERGRLMQSMPKGSMVSANLTIDQAEKFVTNKISIATANAPDWCALAGPDEEIEKLKQKLDSDNTHFTELRTSHAFHSSMMDPILDEFANFVGQFSIHPPTIAFISNVTGDWITAEEATDPVYWAKHIRGTVLFSKGIQTLLNDEYDLFLEVGPGKVLTTLSSHHFQSEKIRSLNTTRHPKETLNDEQKLFQAIGLCWASGCEIQWRAINKQDKANIVSLPSYPFEQRRCFVEKTSQPIAVRTSNVEQPDHEVDWLYESIWKPSPLPKGNERLVHDEEAPLVLFTTDELAISSMIEEFRRSGYNIITVMPGADFKCIDNKNFVLSPFHQDHYNQFIEHLVSMNCIPRQILHFWSYGKADRSLDFSRTQYLGFYSLLFLVQSLMEKALDEKPRILVATTGINQVLDDDVINPERASILSLCHALPHEFPRIRLQNIDFRMPSDESEQQQHFSTIKSEVLSHTAERLIAYRHNQRWLPSFQSIHPKRSEALNLLSYGGNYVITGGLGSIGMSVATELVKYVGANIALIGRSEFPDQSEWESIAERDNVNKDVIVRVKTLLKLQQLGAKVNVLQADVSNIEEMRSALSSVEANLGEITGVIHCAKDTCKESLKPIQTMQVNDCEMQFKAKAHGVNVLEALLEDRHIKFCVLMSSLSSWLAEGGFTSYAAANLYMDAFAKSKRHDRHTRWISINWDGWQFQSIDKQGSNIKNEHAIKAAEGWRLFHYILTEAPRSEVMVSAIPLSSRYIERYTQQFLLSRREHEKQQLLEENFDELLTEGPQSITVNKYSSKETIEDYLLGLWKDFLGDNNLCISDDFFGIGGESLLAVQLINTINENISLSESLTFNSLVAHPTINQLAEVIHRQFNTSDTNEYCHYHVLQNGANGTPVFVFHTVGGHCLNYRDLVKCIPNEVPIYGFVSKPIVEGEKGPSFEQMASKYVCDILKLSKPGAIQLVGISSGGTLASEVGRQLTELGHEVGLCAMIDSPAPNAFSGLEGGADLMISIFGQEFDIPAGCMDGLDDEAKITKLKSLAKESGKAHVIPDNFDRDFMPTLQANFDAMNAYEPHDLKFKITFFKHSTELEGLPEHPELYWIEKGLEGVDVIRVPGDHFSMLAFPYVVEIANRIVDKLR